MMRARSCQELRGWEGETDNSAGKNKRREGWRVLGVSGLERLPLPLAGRRGGVTLAEPCRAVPCRGRSEPLCSCHGPLMNHYPVTWPPSPGAGRRERDLPGKQQLSLQFKDNMPFTGTAPSSSPFGFKGQNCHPR